LPRIVETPAEWRVLNRLIHDSRLPGWERETLRVEDGP
jgi:hypothetical protein